MSSSLAIKISTLADRIPSALEALCKEIGLSDEDRAEHLVPLMSELCEQLEMASDFIEDNNTEEEDEYEDTDLEFDEDEGL